MSKTNQISTLRGMRDSFGTELQLRKAVTDKMLMVATQFGYTELETPIMEHSDIFLRTSGETSDIVMKETYTFNDRDKRSITLRPEFTAATMRAIISNGWIQKLPQRIVSHGPLFRHERPQKGRYRQFYQLNSELVGIFPPWGEIEMIFMCNNMLKILELQNDVTLEINYIVDGKLLKIYTQDLSSYLLKHVEMLSETSNEKLQRNPIRVLDSKEKVDQQILNGAPKITDYLDDISKQEYTKIMQILDEMKIRYKQNSNIVRGLDYYKGLVFEFTTTKLGSQSTIIAGGRYNGLLETIQEKTIIDKNNIIPAIGFAVGIDRICMLLNHYDNVIDCKKQKVILHIVAVGENATKKALFIAEIFRNSGIEVIIDYSATSIKKAFKNAEREGASYIAILEDEKICYNAIMIKNLKTKQEQSVNFCDLENFAEQLQ